MERGAEMVAKWVTIGALYSANAQDAGVTHTLSGTA